MRQVIISIKFCYWSFGKQEETFFVLVNCPLVRWKLTLARVGNDGLLKEVGFQNNE